MSKDLYAHSMYDRDYTHAPTGETWEHYEQRHKEKERDRERYYNSDEFKQRQQEIANRKRASEEAELLGKLRKEQEEKENSVRLQKREKLYSIFVKKVIEELERDANIAIQVLNMSEQEMRDKLKQIPKKCSRWEQYYTDVISPTVYIRYDLYKTTHYSTEKCINITLGIKSRLSNYWSSAVLISSTEKTSTIRFSKAWVGTNYNIDKIKSRLINLDKIKSSIDYIVRDKIWSFSDFELDYYALELDKFFDKMSELTNKSPKR